MLDQAHWHESSFVLEHEAKFDEVDLHQDNRRKFSREARSGVQVHGSPFYVHTLTALSSP
ncbi:hypothetical protein SCHPADRAFT_903390, partial [Schizopora paradoxa]